MLDRETLQQHIAEGKVIRYVFFWGHTANPGKIGPTCMSQWYESEFSVDGQFYPTAEHFMMAEKARLFGDEEMEREIIMCAHPGEAKKCGRLVANFDEDEWEDNRIDIVIRGNLAKFSQHQGLKEYLLRTGDKVLVEASPRDRIWGIGLSQKDAKAHNPFLWKGDNLLGFALMEVREQLREEEA